MSQPAAKHASLDEWIACDAIPFSFESPDRFNVAVDTLVASLGTSVELLGLGEALHGGEDILILRNRLFQRLVEAHGYSAIAIESCFVGARAVNDYVAGRSQTSYDEIQETGFSHGFGRLVANRELVEWMRNYNQKPRAGRSEPIKLQFYGFDMPTGTFRSASPRGALHVVLDYLALMESECSGERRQRIDSLLGADEAWENPAAFADPSKSVGNSPAATALRIETEDLIMELRTRRSEWVGKSDEGSYLEALQYASAGREILNYHAAMARNAGANTLLGIRDTLMADHLAYIVGRERGRGKVLAFAHNSHLQRGKAVWPWYAFWPAGSHLDEMMGARYAAISSTVGVSNDNGIGTPEPETLEARLTANSGQGLFIPTYRGDAIPGTELAALPLRSGSTKNPTYSALTPQSLTDYDYLAFLKKTTYNRGGPPLR